MMCRSPVRRDRKLGLTTWESYSSVRTAVVQETDSTADRLKSFARPLASQVRSTPQSQG
jgi:hypothetical protein